MINLIDFYKNKKYNVSFRSELLNDGVKYILQNYNLTTHEIMLLNAFERSLNYYGENLEKYDLCFWNGTILKDYQLTNEKIPESYVKQINKYFPHLDLYITVINTESKTFTLKNINHKIIRFNEETVIEDIVKIIFDTLPRCNWCGRLFTKTRKNKKYCSKECKKYSLEEQYRVNNRNYYNRYKDVMSERSKGQLGSKGANLHGRADLNPLTELQKVRNAKRALGLKPIQ